MLCRINLLNGKCCVIILFREFRREDKITFEEFQHAGWCLEEYLIYLSLCEDIRATLICFEKYDLEKLDKRKNN